MPGIKKYIIFFIILFVQCKTKNNRHLSALFDIIQKNFSETFIKEVRDTHEENVLDIYFSTFLYEYGEMTNKNSNLIDMLKALNFEDEPSQAYGALLLWHKWLNNKNIDMNEILKMTNDTIRGVKSCNVLKKINAVYNYKMINAGEDIQMLFSVRDESEIKSTAYFLCPILNWDFDASKDLQINGKLISKYAKGNPKEYYFHLKITKMNRKDVLYFFNYIQENDTIDINLNSYGTRI